MVYGNSYNQLILRKLTENQPLTQDSYLGPSYTIRKIDYGLITPYRFIHIVCLSEIKLSRLKLISVKRFNSFF